MSIKPSWGVRMSDRIGVSQASKMLRISPITVRKLVRKGILPAFQVIGVKGYQFRRQDVEALLRPVEPDLEVQPKEPKKKKSS